MMMTNLQGRVRAPGNRYGSTDGTHVGSNHDITHR